MKHSDSVVYTFINYFTGVEVISNINEFSKLTKVSRGFMFKAISKYGKDYVLTNGWYIKGDSSSLEFSRYSNIWLHNGIVYISGVKASVASGVDREILKNPVTGIYPKGLRYLTFKDNKQEVGKLLGFL